MIRRKRLENEKRFAVLCSWCGSKIRDDQQRDTKGLCLRCFYQILRKQLLTQKRTVEGEFVSDR